MEKKRHCSQRIKRGLSLVLALIMLLGMVPVTSVRAADSGTTLYLVPNSNWKKENARFAVYYWNSTGTNAWTNAVDNGEGYYEATIPTGYNNIIFCRMNPSATANNWNNKWNQTADLTVPTDGTNCYTVKDGTWDKGGGTWSVYTPEGETEEETTAPTEPEDQPTGTYYVAGDAALCGVEWSADAAANKMDYVGDGVYEKVYSNVAAGTYSLKVTDGTWDNNWGDNGSNYTFVVSVACDVTVAFDSNTKTVSVTGANVGRETGLEITSMHAVGNGSGNWLGGKSWDVTANAMTEVSPDVYEITFKDVPAGTGYEFKFAANSNWTHSWGSGGAVGEAVYNGQNISLTVTPAVADVILRLDLSGYDHSAKTGATYSATVVENTTEPIALEYYLAGYINGADYGIGDDAANLGEYKFDSNGLTVTFTQDSYVLVKDSNNVTYMTDTFCTDTTATLTTAGTEKMLVPGGVELDFTLDVNADGTLTLGYEKTGVVAATYIIAGVADLCGTEWDVANTANTMTLNADGLYEKTYADVPAGTYEFKVTDGTWENSWGDNGGNYVLTLTETSNVTILFDDAAKVITVNAVAAGPEIPAGYTTVTIHFYKPEGWGASVNAYTWGGCDNGVWPGSAIPANASHAGWYDLIVAQETPTAFNFIFNDGGNQTSDLATGEVTGNTELWVVGNDIMTTAPGEWTGDYDYTANIYFLKPADWGDSINVFLWNDSGVLPGYEAYGVWPGIAAEADNINAGWYNVSVTMDENAGFNFIFNDGRGNQTVNLSTGTLSVATNLWAVDGQVLTTAPAGWIDPNRTVHVPGTFPGPSWDAASNQMIYYANLGLYALTFEDVPAANYEFKIAINGSWAENYGAGGVRDGSNISVTVPETMDVTVYYSPVTNIAVTNVDYKFIMAAVTGTGIEDTALTDPGLTGVYSGTVYMAAGTYSDVAILSGDDVYTFAEIVVDEGKDVTFYFDPVTELYYCNASNTPIDVSGVYFNSQLETYKAPFGAVAAGEEVRFSIATGDDITSAVLVIKGVSSVPMTKGEDGLWTAVTSVPNIGEYDYYFALSNGSTIAIYGDDDGYYGAGTVTDLTGVMPYDLVVYEAGFETPDWMKNAVIYQIFPDRFFDGDVTNNRAQTWARGEVDYEYITDWYTLPENPEQEAMLDKDTYLSSGAHYGDGQWSNEIYGGDLQGIIQRIDYLKALGVNVIYLNPVFWSISNHRYDAVSYTEIDPILGTLGDFEELVAVAEANDMHIILDGVFNHVSDDSVYFDRYYKFLGTSEKIGAYPYWAYVYDYMSENGSDQTVAEEAAKAYFSENYGITDWSYTEWFAVSSTTMSGAVDSIGLRAGKEVYSYEGWWGYDSMPIIYSTNGSEYQTGNWAEEIISGDDSVNAYWISKGMDGWRLDVANEVSDETWQNFRDSVKALDSDAVIIGEIWDDATKYLMGDMYDSVMNYMFRNAVTSFAMGTGAADTTKAMEKIRERYPEEAFYAMMNLVGSHDTTRILSYLDGIGDDRNQKDFNSAFPTYEGTSQLAKDRQYLVSFLQFTYAGAPTIYYGDEIGMVGSDDPDDRRAFEWGTGNQALVEWYARLAAIRDAYPALRTGSVEPVTLANNNLLAYVRQDEANTVLVIANNAQTAQTLNLDGSYVDLVTGEAFGGTVPALNGVILVAEDEAKTITVNTADLAPAYDPAYIVGERNVVATGWSGYTTWVLTTDGTLTFSPSGQSYNGKVNMRNYYKVDGVLTLPWGDYAELITTVVVEEGIHAVGQMAFYELPNLKTVVLADSVEEIRNYAFKNCVSLTTVTGTENLQNICQGAFYGCAALTGLVIPEGCTVGDWAFTRSGVTVG